MRQQFSQIIACVGLSFLLAACSSGPEVPEFRTEGMTLAPKKATSRPYQIDGVWYYPQPHYEYEEEGLASYYGGGDVFHGRPTATGEKFDMNGITAAHKTIPLPCIAKVTNLENGRELVVKVNDRGPFVSGRIIDLSRRSAQLLGFEGKGLAKVRVVTLVPESLALNGIDSPTVMMAQEGTGSSPVTVPAVPITTTSIATTQITAPETLFEALQGPEIASIERGESFEDNQASTSVATTESLPLFEVAEAPAPVMVVETHPTSPIPTTNSSPLPAKLEAFPQTGIFVHVGEYESHAKAQALSRTLDGFYDSPIGIVKNSGSKPYAASLGPFPSMSLANQVLDQLINAGHVISRIVIQH